MKNSLPAAVADSKRAFARSLGRVAAACVLTLVAQAGAHAADYPDRPVRIIVPSGAGGPTDMLARLVGERLSRMWKQPVLVDNRPGGAQMIGTDLVAKAAPNGYTLLLTSDGSITINPALYPSMPYDPVADLLPILKVASVPLVMVVHPDVPAKSVGEFVALARKQPGVLNFGSGGGISRMGAELLSFMTDLQMVHVPYKGSGPLVTGLLGNEVQMAFDGASSSLPHIKSGRLRALAISSKQRLATLPDVPTVSESGVAGYESGAWLGLFAPPGTPPQVIDSIRRDFAAVVSAADLQPRLADLGMTPLPSTPSEFASEIRSETAKWAALIKRAGIRADQ